MGKPEKALCKIYKNLVQQQVQQEVRNVCDVSRSSFLQIYLVLGKY